MTDILKYGVLIVGCLGFEARELQHPKLRGDIKIAYTQRLLTFLPRAGLGGNTTQYTVLPRTSSSETQLIMTSKNEWRAGDFGIRPVRVANCSGYHGTTSHTQPRYL